MGRWTPSCSQLWAGPGAFLPLVPAPPQGRHVGFCPSVLASPLGPPVLSVIKRSPGWQGRPLLVLRASPHPRGAEVHHPVTLVSLHPPTRGSAGQDRPGLSARAPSLSSSLCKHGAVQRLSDQPQPDIPAEHGALPGRDHLPLLGAPGRGREVGAGPRVTRSPAALNPSLPAPETRIGDLRPRQHWANLWRGPQPGRSLCHLMGCKRVGRGQRTGRRGAGSAWPGSVGVLLSTSRVDPGGSLRALEEMQGAGSPRSTARSPQHTPIPGRTGVRHPPGSRVEVPEAEIVLFPREGKNQYPQAFGVPSQDLFTAIYR